MLRDSDVLILDDSLSAVDGKTEANIIRNLKELFIVDIKPIMIVIYREVAFIFPIYSSSVIISTITINVHHAKNHNNNLFVHISGKNNAIIIRQIR